MTSIEHAAYNAGIKAAINAAQIMAITIETANNANAFQEKVAAKTLAAFLKNARGLMLADQVEPNVSTKENNIGCRLEDSV